MQPDQQNNQSQPHEQYDFIMNPGQAPKKPLVPLPGLPKVAKGNSVIQRLLIVGVGALLLIVIAMVVIGFLSSASKASAQKAVDLLVTQQKLITLADEGSDKATDTAVRNKAISIKLVVLSDQQALKTQLASTNTKAPKGLSSVKDSEAETALTQASLSNTYDQTLDSLLTSRLASYQKAAKSTYDSATSVKLKKLLDESYKNAGTIAAKS